MLHQMMVVFTVGFIGLGVAAVVETKEPAVVVLVVVMYGGIVAIARWCRRHLIPPATED